MSRPVSRLIAPLKRQPLATAIGFSLLVHFALLWDGEWEWPDFSPSSPDEMLSKKKAESIPRVRLNIKPPARPKPQQGAAIVTIIEETPPSAEKIAPEKPKQPKKNVASKKPKADKPEEPINGDNLAAQGNAPPDKPLTDNSSSSQQNSEKAIPLGDNLPPPPEELSKKSTPVDAPPPSFPVEIHALLKASFKGVGVEIKQTWRMEGERYSIDNEARKLVFTARMASEGTVSDNGISPEHFRMYINNKLHSYADIDKSTSSIRFGKASEAKYASIQSDIQDIASLPFQMAVSFTGVDNRQMQVTSGSSVYSIELKLLSEEMLKLPAGIVKTLHLQGQRTNLGTGIAQQGYDVWLAPDYRNFPVKFRGPTSKGDIMEYSLKSLNFEGQTVLGKNLKPEPETADTGDIPKELLEHIPPTPTTKPALDVGEDAP